MNGREVREKERKIVIGTTIGISGVASAATDDRPLSRLRSALTSYAHSSRRRNEEYRGLLFEPDCRVVLLSQIVHRGVKTQSTFSKRTKGVLKSREYRILKNASNLAYFVQAKYHQGCSS